MSIKVVKMYGAQWCPDCRRSKAFLDAHGVSYEYVDLEKIPDAAGEVEKINNGLQRIPTIVFSDDSVLVEPSDEELAQKLDIEI
ncbi:glutathione S-transferase N-terminal domain-containing protein [Candidatus Woesebacteria bacterium]|nr:glutathione S-transferase N-terminal domain-containing protein [Candidatus Woesebacteria bacterium]